MITWQCKFFAELSNMEVYKILQLRNEVFIVEQNFVYKDCDDKDFKAWHLCAWQDEKLVAYTRLFDKGISYRDAASIGRVVTVPSVRGQKLGKELMLRSIKEIEELFGETTIRISAQLYLKRFYESFSFVQKGEVYLEDSIEHISMIKNIKT
ncbi:MAG: GNAT family N-acetyltransferase [Ginsengibacter sp.]